MASHVWHPCTQMKDHETYPPLPIARAKGSYLYDPEGRAYIDGTSSWWCKSLGHAHPALVEALKDQADHFEHVMLANTTNSVIESLSDKLSQLCPSLNKVSYASDGSCAVEIALKMAVHGQALAGRPHKTAFMGIAGSYHGETALTMSVSDLGLYKKPYASLMHSYPILQGIPYVKNTDDPLWHDALSHWPGIEAQLEEHGPHVAALILEPILQGAAGMLIYSADALKRIHDWCKKNNVWLIADEIMTGFGRTGKALACEHAGIEPDFLCLSKGLTSGYLPISAMITRDDIYDLFYDDYETGKAFLHSHTHTGNALAARVALATLEVIEESKLYETVQKNAPKAAKLMQDIADESEYLHNVRSIGGMVAADIIPRENQTRAGFTFAKEARKNGALLRPLGNTLYWLPPLNSPMSLWEELQNITKKSLCV